jgi:hypothetical protein
MFQERGQLAGYACPLLTRNPKDPVKLRIIWRNSHYLNPVFRSIDPQHPTLGRDKNILVHITSVSERSDLIVPPLRAARRPSLTYPIIGSRRPPETFRLPSGFIDGRS